MTSYGIIGTGHLGSMLAEEFVRRGAISREELWVSNRSQEKAQRLARKLGVRAADNLKVAERSDVLFLCVRPVDLKGVIAETSELLTPEKLIVSVAVDFSLRQLENLCRARAARAIPSVASGKGLGVTLLVLGSDASEDDRSLALSALRVHWLAGGGGRGAAGGAIRSHQQRARVYLCHPQGVRPGSLYAGWKGG
ncbi:pyrroline-5-carboxylate reductase family protein [Methanothrix soehngenii]|uniref:pyrroline-5-carboxylate reductase family protein n=1 Tax=Methanothrix soehngenii TaxID=2223 RepID=UPI00300D34F9